MASVSASSSLPMDTKLVSSRGFRLYPHGRSTFASRLAHCLGCIPRPFSYRPSPLLSWETISARSLEGDGASSQPTSLSSLARSLTLSRTRLECGVLVSDYLYLNTTIELTIPGRVIIGSGVGIVKVAAPILIQEIAHPRLRPILGSCYQTFAYIGALLAALMTFAGLYVPGEWSWRFPSLLQTIFPIIIIVVATFCPESPRWLIKNGRSNQALKILARYHANGDTCDSLVQLEFREILTALDHETTLRQASFLDFLRTPGNRRRLFTIAMLALSLNWVGNGIISHYLTPMLKSVGVTAPTHICIINAALALWNLILSGLAATQCDRIGRRPLFLTSIAGMLVSYCLIMGLSAEFDATKKAGIGAAVIPFLFIYFGFYDIAFTPLPVTYIVEILPFSIRSKGMALFTSTASLGDSFNQFVNPIALGRMGWRL